MPPARLTDLAVAEGDIIATRQVIARILAPGEDAPPSADAPQTISSPPPPPADRPEP